VRPPTDTDTAAPGGAGSAPATSTAPRPGSGTHGLFGLVVKIGGLGLAAGTAVALTPSLVRQERWGFLGIIWAVAVVLLATYATRRFIPGKYLVPGTLFLALLVVVPIILTFQLSTTNFGDGTRGTKEATVNSIVGASVVQSPDAPRYNLTVATTGSPTEGPFAFLLVDPTAETAFVGTEEGLEPAGDDVVVTDGFVTEAPGYTLLTPQEVNAAGPELGQFSVPTETGAIRQLGIRQAFEGQTVLEYDEASDTITNTQTGVTYTVQPVGDREYFVSEDGQRLSDQSWQADVGFRNYERIFTDPRISRDFVSIFIWTLIFATASVVTTFALGLFLAITLNDPRVRGQKIYRALIIMPYAIPGFIAILIWSGFFNRDFGLINDITGLDVNWFGGTWSARLAVILTNLWMGFPYMFLVCTGALQAIPGDLKEAAAIDGASGWFGFRKITLPLLLVAVAPLLVATFAFNFNNFNIIQLLTEGGPFSPANPTAGGTDILISYTIRLAFGAGGAQIGFASAVSVVLFVLTGVIAALQFRLTRSLEDVN
jgi:arabinogalactan oligomer / maltooligosaccharide transport system permease protein